MTKQSYMLDTAEKQANAHDMFSLLEEDFVKVNVYLQTLSVTKISEDQKYDVSTKIFIINLTIKSCLPNLAKYVEIK